jgi:hypothetical protein
MDIIGKTSFEQSLRALTSFRLGKSGIIVFRFLIEGIVCVSH